MSFRPERRPAGRWTVVLGMVAVLAVGPAFTARAADPADSLGAIAELPADTAFYAAMLRNREQIEAIGKSKAWAKLSSLPMVKLMVEKFQEGFDQGLNNNPDAKKLLDWYAQPENKQLVEMLTEMVSDEIYVTGDARWVESADLISKLEAAARVGQLSAIGNQPDPEKAQKIMAKAMLDAVAANPKLVKLPSLVFGFKVRDTDKAKAQLKRIEDLLNAFTLLPGFPGKIQKAKVAGGDFMSLTIDAESLPWDQVNMKEFEDKPGQYDDVIKKLKSMKLNVSLGLRGKYVVLSIGESTDFLAKFGQGDKLIATTELKPLAKAADKRLTSITYLSKPLAERVSASKKDLDSYLEMAEKALPNSPLPEEVQTRIKKDLAKFIDEMKGFIPDPGASVSFGFLSERGSESFSYSYVDTKNVESTKPLTLLNHVGGDPLMAVVGRTKLSPDSYARLVKWVGIGWSYFDDFAVPTFDDDKKKDYESFMKDARPLFARFNKVTEKMLLPALADGQMGFVLDAKLTNKQWIAAAPESKKPLPMFEPAIILGVSDAPLLEKAAGEYRDIANQLYAAMQKVNPDAPAFEIPAPEKQKLNGGTGYFFRLPAEWGLDERVVPNAALSDKVAVMSITQDHSERLLKATPLKLSSPLMNREKPLAHASYIRWSGFVDVLDAWTDYGFEVAGPFAAIQGVQQGQLDEAQKTVKVVYEVLKVFHSTTSVTYVDGGALVTHSETLIIDK